MLAADLLPPDRVSRADAWVLLTRDDGSGEVARPVFGILLDELVDDLTVYAIDHYEAPALGDRLVAV